MHPKKVGGPINLLLLTGATGAAIYKACEIGVKKCVKAIKSHQTTTDMNSESQHKLYSVIQPRVSNEGIEFSVGSQYRVLETDGGSVLIEKIGDQNNPYFVSAEFLSSISEYNA